jgi:sugar/nucleoside kinase (ribokinase family)
MGGVHSALQQADELPEANVLSVAGGVGWVVATGRVAAGGPTSFITCVR